MEQSRTAYVILGVLSIKGNKSGYDIRKGIESSVGHFWGESYGQIYPALKRLAQQELIVPATPGNGARSRRQEYSITDAGRVALSEWLALPFQNDPPRNEFLLKLFFGLEAPKGVTVAHIRELQAKNERSLAQMHALQSIVPKENPNNPHLLYWMLTLELGIVMTRAALEWGESAQARLIEAEACAVSTEPANKEQPAPDKGSDSRS